MCVREVDGECYCGSVRSKHDRVPPRLNTLYYTPSQVTYRHCVSLLEGSLTVDTNKQKPE